MKQRGQALIILIVAVAISLSVLAAITLAAIGQGKNSYRNELGRKVYYAAEAGAEHALIKLMRNPASCSGSENLTIDSVNVTISYSGNCNVTAQANQGGIIKKVAVQAAYTPAQIFNYSGWRETQ